VAAVAGGLTVSGATRIDSHQHFWRLDRGDYRWLTPGLKPLYRDFLPEHLAPQQAAEGVGRTVLVQAADTEAETAFLLSLAESAGFVGGVVGWVDMESPAAPRRLAELAGNPRFKGIRPMIQDIPDPGWMLRPGSTPAFEALIECELSFDALVTPEHLDNLLVLLKRHPKLRAVIDHGAKPRIGAGELRPWRRAMAALAEETSVCCKLSGLVTEAGERADAERLQPYVDELVERFGPERLMWGSDWPVVELVMSYRQWNGLTESLLGNLGPEQRAWILDKTARGFYRLDDG